MTEQIDLDALEARASETAAVVNGFDVLALIAELRQAREEISLGDEQKYETLGDIAKTMERMKADGMTRGSVLYALDRVYW